MAVKADKRQVMQFCRTVAPVLRVVSFLLKPNISADLLQKENITINVVLPGIVKTAIIPQAMIDAVSPECMTPVDTIVKAYNMFLSDKSRTGQVAECSTSDILLLPDPPLLNGHKTKRACTVWDPLFIAMHGEASGLTEAIAGEADVTSWDKA